DRVDGAERRKGSALVDGVVPLVPVEERCPMRDPFAAEVHAALGTDWPPAVLVGQSWRYVVSLVDVDDAETVPVGPHPVAHGAVGRIGSGTAINDPGSPFVGEIDGKATGDVRRLALAGPEVVTSENMVSDRAAV